MNTLNRILIAGIVITAVMVIFYSLGLLKTPTKPPERELAIESCIASTVNIAEYHKATESNGYPVGRVMALTKTGYYVMIYIPDLNFIGSLEIPYTDEVKFQEVHCPEILGGDRE